MNRSHKDIAFLVIITVLCFIILLVTSSKNFIVRVLPSMLLLFFLPGYSLLIAIFPSRDMGYLKLILFSISISILMVLLLCLIIYLMDVEVPSTDIFLIFALLTVFLALPAHIRRDKLLKEEKHEIKPEKIHKIEDKPSRRAKIDKISSIILITALILAICATVYIIVNPQPGESFTEFYILGPKGKASDYPTNLTIGETGKVIIGIVNHEHAVTDYLLVVKLKGKIIKKQNVTLASDNKKEIPYTFEVSRSGENQKLEFLLYKLPDSKKIYRSLHLWIDVDSG